MSYLTWNTKTIDQKDDTLVSASYDAGFVFGRPEPGNMFQTRSMRIALDAFEMSSENRRIMRKTEGLELMIHTLPFTDYHWSIGKIAKDFYDAKFGDGTFSANKVKELLTTEHNFNQLLTYEFDGETVAYVICYENDEMMHYSYPFYNLDIDMKNIGMGMMLRAIQQAKDAGKQYIYLGSAQRPSDTYKLQFKGLEWFDGEAWQTDHAALKELLQA